MKRIVAGFVLFTLTFTITSADAQNGSVWLSQSSPNASESTRVVVVSVSLWRAGRVAYKTMDGDCAVEFSRGGTAPEATCSRYGAARADEDYTARSGELVFTDVAASCEPGDAACSQKIHIPIADDDVDDSGESFTFAAWEVANADPWIDRGDSMVFEILDNEDENDSYDYNASAGSGTATSSTTAPERSPRSRSAPLGTQPPKPSSIGNRPARGLTADVASPSLQPGPGFELRSDAPPRVPTSPATRREQSSSWPIGLGAAALAGGGLALVRRRGRWSPTQP
jgi:LPXTG-motif cell wall-anchored protein